MTIYLEVAIIDNITVNWLLLYLSGKILKIRLNILRTVLAVLLGTLFAIIFPLLFVPAYVLVVLKLMLGFVMIYLAMPTKKVKKILFEFVVFCVLTFLLAGFVFAVYELLGINLNDFVLISSSSVYPISVFALMLIVFVRLVVKICKAVISVAKRQKQKFFVKLFEDGKEFKLRAYFDSGNLLKDTESELPICVISKNVFFNIYKNVSAIDMVLKKHVNLKNSHYISFSTISSGRANMLVFSPDKMQVFNGKEWKDEKILLGVSLSGRAYEDFDLLLNAYCEV